MLTVSFPAPIAPSNFYNQDGHLWYSMPRLANKSCPTNMFGMVMYRWDVPEDLAVDPTYRLRLSNNVCDIEHFSGEFRVRAAPAPAALGDDVFRVGGDAELLFYGTCYLLMLVAGCLLYVTIRLPRLREEAVEGLSVNDSPTKHFSDEFRVRAAPDTAALGDDVPGLRSDVSAPVYYGVNFLMMLWLLWLSYMSLVLQYPLDGTAPLGDHGIEPGWWDAEHWFFYGSIYLLMAVTAGSLILSSTRAVTAFIRDVQKGCTDWTKHDVKKGSIDF